MIVQVNILYKTWINLNRKCFLLLVSIFAGAGTLRAQGIPDRPISLEIKSQPLGDVLEIISNQGNFYFSYNSNIISKDSLVSITVNNKPLRQVLDQLFRNRYTYRISGKYIILRLAESPNPPVQKTAGDNSYMIRGYIVDQETGEGIQDASVYEKQHLQSALTDANGYFSIKLKNGHAVSLTVSKAYYDDTSVYVLPQTGQQLLIRVMATRLTAQPVELSPAPANPPASIGLNTPWNNHSPPFFFDGTHNQVERTMLGRMMLSSRQKIQSINLRKFFANRTMQVSLTPGLSTQGKLSSQVINHYSLNIVGGYTGGAEGIELAGLFNLNRKSVKVFQAAGSVNVTGGALRGVQLAGFNNTVLDSVHGLQAAGFANMVVGAMQGVQLAGLVNVAGHDVRGVQAAGYGNVGCMNVRGLQVAPNFNVAAKEMNGLQLSAGVNYAHRLKGVQIGMVNIADTSEGYSIGIINIVRKGYHKLTISSNEVIPLNLGFKSGNRKLYSILSAGIRPDSSQTIYSFGYGAGSDIALGKQWYFNPEITTSYLYMGNWNATHVLNRIQLHASWHIHKKFSIFAGPSFNAYYSASNTTTESNHVNLPHTGYPVFKLWNNQWTGWFGWSAGIVIF